ncbi:MAG: BofC C-terminal domain-containing protein [Oscillospiraceae bacterium]
MTFYKKTFAILCLTLGILMLALSICLVIQPYPSAPKQTEYFLMDNGGFVALYKDNIQYPIRTFPQIYTRLLPFETAVNLQNGIKVENETELCGIIESLIEKNKTLQN